MKMRCIFLDAQGFCLAHPKIESLEKAFSPENDVKKEYCETENFGKCPRLATTYDYFRAITKGI
jgi:hypothetical protein